MGKMDDRTNFIIHLLQTEAGNGLSISEVHELLYSRFLENCSRRTAERELVALERMGKIKKIGRYPARYRIVDSDEKVITLTAGEVSYLHLILKEHFKNIKAQNILAKLL